MTWWYKGHQGISRHATDQYFEQNTDTPVYKDELQM